MPNFTPPVSAVMLARRLSEGVRDLVVQEYLGELGVRLVQVIFKAAVEINVRQFVAGDLQHKLEGIVGACLLESREHLAFGRPFRGAAESRDANIRNRI